MIVRFDPSMIFAEFFLWVLTIVFITLRLCGVIDWSWGWVLAPLWMPVVVFLFLLGIVWLISIIFQDDESRKGR